MILDQPVDAVRGATFLVSGERDDDVAVGNAGVAEPLRQRESDRRDAAGLVPRIDLDDLFVDLAGELLMRGKYTGRVAGLPDLRAQWKRECGKENQSSFHELLLGRFI